MAYLKSDPLRNFKFRVNFGTVGNGGTAANQVALNLGFMSVQGLASQTDVIPYREGEMNTHPRKMPGQTDFSPITFARGANLSSYHQFKWYSKVFSWDAGTGYGGNEQVHMGATPSLPYREGGFRTYVDIDVIGHPITSAEGWDGNDGAVFPVKVRYGLKNAWPSSIAWSDLDAAGNGVLIEQLTLVHEGFYVVWTANPDGHITSSTPSQIVA